MYGVDEFLELIEGGGGAVEFGEGGVDVHEVEGGEGAAVLSHAGIGGGRGVNGKKLDDVAAEVTDDEVELFDEVAKGAGGGEDGVVCFGELINGCLVLGLYGVLIAGGAEEADKGGVEGVVRGGFGGFRFDDGVAPFWPVKGLIEGAKIGFGFVAADVGERECEFPGSVCFFVHGDVVPVTIQGG